jgi:hypothetical protein
MRSRNAPLSPSTTVTILALIILFPSSAAPQLSSVSQPQFSTAVAFDISPEVRDLPRGKNRMSTFSLTGLQEVRPEYGPIARNKGFSGDGAVQASQITTTAASIPSPLLTFEGLSNLDNFDLFGDRFNPPDPNGDVGPNHYVEMVNLAFAVYDKQGNKLSGPTELGTLWADFAIPDCADSTGDPVVVYDQFADRWILTQFTMRGKKDPALPFYNCVAVSQSGDPTGGYFRYAFITSAPGSKTFLIPDYPKYGVWKRSYVLTSRDSASTGEYGVSVYALEKSKMITGIPNARAVHFFLDSTSVPANLIGDGLLPADVDGKVQPTDTAAIPIMGVQDDGGPFGATFDALNIWDLRIQWQTIPQSSLVFRTSLRVSPFDSIFPCGVVRGSQRPDARDCLPQPGITDGSRFLDILSYRQRLMFRLAYRKFGTYESMVTNQSVEARPGIAGVRWYEIRRTNGQYSLFQQGTYAPTDGVHRWMGSIAQDKLGNMALGYSVVNGTSVFPGIRYTGRIKGNPKGEMSLGEATLISGTGIQLTPNSRWGDYTSMNIDPVDDCTFWYVNEYYRIKGTSANPAPWQTRIGSFKLPGCQ